MAITTVAKVKEVLQISTTDHDTLIGSLIALVEDDYLRIRNKAFDTDEDDDIVYPTGSELTAIKMVGYILRQQGLGGIVQSKNMGVLSVTYMPADSSGYPAGITNTIKRYQEVG